MSLYPRAQSHVSLSANPPSTVYGVNRGISQRRPDEELYKYLRMGANKWLACMMRPDMPCRMPMPDGGYGTAIVTAQLWVELTTDANGDVRQIVSPFPQFLLTTIVPGTGVHTAVAAPESATIIAKFERLRPLHLSRLDTYYGDRDTTGGMIVTQVVLADNSIATWNDDADVLARKHHSHANRLVDGAYAYAVNEPIRAAEFNSLLITAATTAGAGVSTSQYAFIKTSISSAKVSTSLARSEIIGSWEGYTEDQLFPIMREANKVEEFWHAYELIDLLNIPRVFMNDEHEDAIRAYLHQSLTHSTPFSSAVGSLLLTGAFPPGTIIN